MRKGAILAQWQQIMGRRGANPLKWKLLQNDLFSSGELLPWIKRNRDEARDRKESRSLVLLERLVLDTHVEQYPTVARLRSNLEERIVGFRPLWKGRRVNRAVVETQLLTSKNRDERKSAWYAQEPLQRSIEKGLRRLAMGRNERAREFGCGSYPEFRLGFEGFRVAGLIELTDSIGTYVREAARVKRARFEEATGLSDWYPWDTRYSEELEARVPQGAFAADQMVPAVIAGVKQWGFGRAALRFRIDRHDLPAGGIEIPVDPPSDVRVIVHPGASWIRYMILFHEVGHAVHARSNLRHPSILKYHEYLPGFPGLVEGVGTLFEEIPHSPEWLMSRPGVKRHEADAMGGTVDLGKITGFIGLLAMIRTELELYRNPGADLERVHAEWIRKLGVYDSFESPSFANTFFVGYPIYVQSYLFASMFARQLLVTMQKDVGGPIWPNAGFAAWLTSNWFENSGEYDWVDQVKAVTGAPLGTRAFGSWVMRVISQMHN